MIIDRNELVTAALLGTDRRPPTLLGALGDAEPASVLLAYAARSAVAYRAGALLPPIPSAPAGPSEHLPPAPPAAQALLAVLLSRPVVELVDAWLRLAADRGLGAAPEQWTPLVTLANRNAELDRAALAAVLGARGVWFCNQNAQWRRLSAALAGLAAPIAEAARSSTGGGTRIIDAQAVAEDPQVIFEAADPWPDELVAEALAIVGSGALLRRGIGYAAAVGLRLPLGLARTVLAAIDQRVRDDRFALDRATRDALTNLERTLQVRLDIEQAFLPVPDQQELP